MRQLRGSVGGSGINRVAALRWSLLVAMGIVPVACGGTAERGPNKDNGGSSAGEDDGGSSAGGSHSKGGTSRGGSTAIGGKNALAGTSNKGGEPPTGGTGPTTLSTCTDPKTDPQTGLVTCSEGYSHRPKAGTCEIVGGASGEGGGGGVPEPGQLPRAKGIEKCGDDPSICRAFAYGYCTFVEEVDVDPGTVCLSGCMEDADCGATGVCVCSGPTDHGGTCKYGACKSDADCAEGFLCASYTPICGSEVAFACHKPDDECRSDADCPEGVGCAVEGSRRICADGFVCGRPFLVNAAMRMAPSSPSDAWTQRDVAVPSTDHLTTSERLALAAHWTKMGQMEHASIAAFARFSLQLLALGAPPDLVEACTAALADETAHTKLCFGIASAYAGRAIGPGPLDIAGSLDVTSLADIVDLVIAEGCFGETGAALEALEAADSATDPVIAAAYSQIAADEQRHAELGFRFVRWALGRDRDVVAERIRAALADCKQVPELVRQVAVPCLEALLSTTPAGRTRARARDPRSRPLA